MNGNPRARISEHAFGNALDIAAFTLADGRKITVKNGWRGSAGGAGLPARRAGRGLRAVHHRAGAGLERLSLRPHPCRPDAARAVRACNPEAVSGEEVAARVGGPRYSGGRRPGEVTGSVEQRRAAHARARPRFAAGVRCRWRNRATTAKTTEAVEPRLASMRPMPGSTMRGNPPGNDRETT